MNKFRTLIAALVIFSAPSLVSAADRAGRVGIAFMGGVVKPITSKAIRQATTDGENLGVMVRYGSSPTFEWAGSFEYHKVTQIEVATGLLSGIYTFFPEAQISPVARLGAGLMTLQGAVGDTETRYRMAVRPGLGLESALSDHVSLGVYGDYIYSPKSTGNDPLYGAYYAGGMLTYFF